QKALFVYDQFLARYPKSRFYVDVLFLKGLTYWHQDLHDEAFQMFSLIEKGYPDFSRRDELLFFTAATYPHQKLNPRTLYKELFSQYPDSPYAPEAYFRYYPEEEYARQDVQAIGHLKKMPNFSRLSPYSLFASFYVASAERQQYPQKSP